MAEEDVGTSVVITQEQMDNAVQEAVAAAKVDGDTAFQNLWKEAKQAKQKAKAFDGIDPAEAKAALARLQELELEGEAGKAGIKGEQLRQIQEQVRKSLEDEYTPFKSENDRLKTRLRELQLDNVVKGVMAKHGVRPERIDALFRLTSDRFDLTDEGEPMLKDRPGYDVSKYVADELGSEWPDLFLPSGSSGGGASKSNASGAGGRPKTVSWSDKVAVSANLEGIANGTVLITE